MQKKQRRRGFALPAGRSFSFHAENDNETGISWVDQRQGTNNNNPAIGHEKSRTAVANSDPYTKSFLGCGEETWDSRRRRSSVASMTLGPQVRRRKNSFQLARFSSRAHNFLQQETESHLAAILGSPGVGKTALIVRYITGRFVHEYDPTLEMTYEKLQEVGNVKGILRIMDTAGSIESCVSYIRRAEGIIVVYSVTDRYSFEMAKDYLRMIKEYTRLGSPFDYELPTILVGNKRELRRAREVSREEAREMAKECGCLFVESSAACDRNVQKIFTNLFLQIHRIKEERQRMISSNTRGFVSSVRNFFQSKKK